MKFGLRLLGLLALLGAQSPALAQCVSLTTAGSAVSQSFNTLANTGTTNNLTITGWFLTESGGGSLDNEQFAADAGGSNSGDTYSYGAAASTERALGGLQSSALIPIFGACFTNNTGVTLVSLRVDYTGEQWRLGTTSRTDRIDFQYSTNAASLVTGSWTDVNELDFTTPFTATAGARDGNAAANRTALTHTIAPVSIANGATFWIRWTDLNASGADDGLAVDDFSLTAAADPCAAISFPYTLPNNASATLVTAIECANANGPSADTIDLNGQMVTLTAAYADYTGATGLPQINTPMTLQNGSISRSGSNQFRLLCVGVSGDLTLNQVTASNGYGLAPGSMGGGGAIYNLGALNIVGGQFNNNYSALDGGAIHNDGGAVNARYTVFSGNSVNTSLGGVGGGLANSFGVVTLSNVLISGNLGVQGAGIYNNNGGTLTLNNSTIAGNSTNDQGAGLRNENTAASVVLNNTIISGNESSLFPANSDLGGSITNNFSLIGGSPAFVAPLDASATAPTTAGNYRLADFSPAIDAGSNSLVPGIITTDLDGNPRRYNDTGVADAGSGTAPIADLGAYEKQTNSVSPCAAVTFPYTLPNNAPATLITAIECANANGTADVINLNGQTVTLTASYASYTGATGLPQVTTAITLQNGNITRSGGAPQFRLLSVGATGSLTVDGVTVSGGSLPSNDNAGAIFNDGGTLAILSSTLTNNSAGFGGALYNSGSAAAITIADSTLSNNSATQSGGFMLNDSGSATIIRSTVSGNSSSGTAGNGAIYNFEADLDIIDSTFTGNTSTTSVGAVQNFAGTTDIANSVFAGNSAANTSGAVLNNAGGVMTITNSMFTGNRAGNAAGALTNNASSTLTITNSTFAGNNATTGGGIFIPGATTTTITNSVVWGNNGNTLTGATITYSIIEGGFAGTGNLNVDPLFVSPLAFTSAPTTAGNYRLQDSSPAVDAGSNAAVPVDTFDLNDNASTTDEAPDLDGNPRRYDDTGVPNTGSGTAPIVDMGAFEKQTNSPPVFPMDVDFCDLRFPTSFTAAAGSTSPLIFGRIYEDDNGVLTSSPGAHPSIVAQVGHGPLGSDPRGGNPAWLWVPATYNVQVGNDDEYRATFIVPFAPTNTQRSYTYRFSVDNGANYTYCDTDGNGTNAGLSFSTANLGTLTIAPGGQPTISINDVALAEGDSGVTPFSFTVSLNGPSLSAVTFDIATADNTATVANGDYVSNSQTGVVIPAGQTSTTFLVLVTRDTTFEPNETFFVNLTNIVGATAGDAQGQGTITNDDDICALYPFPYTMTGNTPAELIQAINCANANGTADVINLNTQTITLTDSFANYSGATGLPQITTNITIRNGTITRSDVNNFRLLAVSSTGNLTVRDMTLTNGGGPPYSSNGGAIFNNGTLTVMSSTVSGNQAREAGGIRNEGAGTVINSLVTGNRANDFAGGLDSFTGTLTVINSTIAGNAAPSGGGIYNEAVLNLQNSIVFGNSPGLGGNVFGTFNNISSLVGIDPAFIAPQSPTSAPTTGGNYRLSNNSVAIDAGSNSVATGANITLDLDGNSRFYDDTGVTDTGSGTAPIVDIGAYEKQTDTPTPCAAYTFPYTLTGNTPAELIQAINCANANGTADVIDLNGQTVTLTEINTSAYGSGTGLPEITTAVVIQNGTITRNSANLFRFFVHSGSSSLTLNNITLSNGNPEWDGGAIWGIGSPTLIINNSRIVGNSGNFGGAIFIPSSGTAVITNTLLSGNRATSPGGAIRSRGNLTLNNSTIAANFTTAGTEGGGGIANNSGTVVLNNSIVHGNEASFFPATNDIRGTFTANNSLVGLNPLFVNLLDAGDTAPTTGGDYRLAAFSPAIDAGSNSLIPGGVTTDLDGNPRRYNDTGVADTGVGSAPIVDIGAYERQTNSVLPQADVAITKTNGTTSSVPGGSTTYTITASNAGPGSPGSATVADTFPPSLSCSWTCIGAGGGACTAAGAGNINDSVNLPSGGSVTYTASCTISAAATGSLSNTATVSTSMTDPNTGNNSATDTDTLSPQADVSITKTDGTTSVNAGSSTVYTITASNAGPSNAPTVTVTDTFPAACVAPTWTCVGAGGGTCALNGTGNINESVNLPAGGSVSFSATCPISAAASGVLSNTATVAAGGVTDPSPANNNATDTNTVIAVPVLSINSVSMTEGDSGSSNLTFTVTRSTTGSAFDVAYATADGTAVAGSDYTTSNGVLTFAAGGAETQIIEVPIIGNNIVEGTEAFTVTLSNATGNAQIGTAVGTGTITDNDSATVQFAPTSVSQSETTSPMAFTVTLSNPVQSGVTLTVNSTPGTAGSPADFTAISGGTVSFAPNSTTPQTVNVVIANESLFEGNETYTLALSSLVAIGNVTLPPGTATATGTITNDDDAPTITISAPSVTEGNPPTNPPLSFVVSLSTASGLPVNFNYATNGAAGTATAGTDYTAIASTAGSIPAGDLSVTLPVTVIGDLVSEGNETVVLALSGISNANVATLSGTGTINDDDIAQITITDAGLTEGDSGSQNLQFTVSRSGNGGAFSVDFATSNATATAGSDYTSSTGTLTFTANGAPSQTINVPITGESLVEVTETFTVTLSNVVNTLGTAAIDDGSGTGTITDNDSATVQFAPTSVSQSEATSPMAFTVTLSNPVQSGVTVTANSTPGTATAADFTAIANATVTFPPNSSTAQTVNVIINNDALDENDEQFTLTLSGLGATGNVTLPLGTATATGTIQDDDATPTLSVANVAQPEGNASNTLTFTASLSAVSGRDVTFTRATQDGTAVSTAPNADFVALPSALVTIPAGTQSVPIAVTINGDTTFEGDQSFALNLTSIVNATPGSLSATGTLQDDDQQPTTTTITSDDPDASLVGQPYTVNVTVAAQTLTPAGTITVSDGTSSCGPVNLIPGTVPNSSASCQLTSTTAGAKTLTATYTPANTAFAASSDTELHQVNAASTTLSVTGPARVRINTPATYTIALAAVAPGGGTPTGTVTVTSGANSCTVTLPATTCNLNFASLGSRTITASYAGNADYNGATSSGSGNASTLVFALSDVQVTKSNGDAFYEPGELQVYTIQLRNVGPDVARNLRLLDTVPAELSGVQWSCDAAGGAICPQNSGTGNIDQAIAEMPLPGLLNYTLFGTVIGRPDQISNTASVQLPADSTIEDPTPGNNSQTDVDQLNTLFRNGFEAASINAPSGSFVLPSAALRSALDGVAISVFRLDDKQGSVLRIYARTFNGEVEYALATRGSIGWQLGSWQRFGGDPTLRWTATRDGEGWRLQSATLQ